MNENEHWFQHTYMGVIQFTVNFEMQDEKEKTHSLQASSNYMALPYRILTLLANHYLMSFGRLRSAAIENIAWFCLKKLHVRMSS